MSLALSVSFDHSIFLFRDRGVFSPFNSCRWALVSQILGRDRLLEFSHWISADLVNSDLNSDSDRDTGTPSKLNDRNSLFMSTENLEKLGQREKFMKSNYETLGKTLEEDSNYTSPQSRKSITAKFKNSPEDEQSQPATATNASKSNASVFEKASSNSSSLSTPLKPQIAKKPNMSPWAAGNHREELSKALQEAKQRLQGVGKGHR